MIGGTYNMEEKFWTADVSCLTKAQIKKKLWEELRLKSDLGTKGIHISEEALEAAELGTKNSEQILEGRHNRELRKGSPLPYSIYLPYGLKYPFAWNKNSPYKIELIHQKPVLIYEDREIGEIQYATRPQYHSRLSSDGTPLCLIGATSPYDKKLFITYSKECCYKENNEDCLFCNINFSKNLYNKKYGEYWRTPKQIAEVVKAAFEEKAAEHFAVSGGVIAERRELDYYVDVAEEVREALDVEEFNGTAVVAAPEDYSNINKLKESGYRTIAMNLEMWNKDFYKAVCPGKANHAGGWENWKRALEYAVGVFGWGRVRSNFVAGIEPKADTLHGIEYLGDKGVIGTFNIWHPNVGSAFEGHRSPETEWYIDLALQVGEIWKKNDFTFDKIHDATAGDHKLPTDVFRIENEIFDIYKEAVDS